MCENKRCGKDLRKAGFKTLDEVVLTERQGQQRVYCSAACSAELKEVA
jgi:succinylarginine dihydrolase